MIGATEQGRLFVFPAEVEPQFDEGQVIDEQVETKHILIVAHEVKKWANFQNLSVLKTIQGSCVLPFC